MLKLFYHCVADSNLGRLRTTNGPRVGLLWPHYCSGEKELSKSGKSRKYLIASYSKKAYRALALLSYFALRDISRRYFAIDKSHSEAKLSQTPNCFSHPC